MNDLYATPPISSNKVTATALPPFYPIFMIGHTVNRWMFKTSTPDAGFAWISGCTSTTTTGVGNYGTYRQPVCY